MWLPDGVPSPLTASADQHLHTLTQLCRHSTWLDHFCNASDGSATFIFTTGPQDTLEVPVAMEELGRGKGEGKGFIRCLHILAETYNMGAGVGWGLYSAISSLDHESESC